MSSQQQNLPGIPVRVPAAWRGREFEFLLDGLHTMYEKQKLAVMYKHEREWTRSDAGTYQVGAKYRPANHAKLANGYYIRAIASVVDYSGTVKPGISVYFDAKQTKGKSLPLENIHQHQTRFALARQQFGAVAGFMVHFSDLNRYFFLWASYVDQVETAALIRRDRKSISVAMCEQNGREIPLNQYSYPDWIAALFPKKESTNETTKTN